MGQNIARKCANLLRLQSLAWTGRSCDRFALDGFDYSFSRQLWWIIIILWWIIMNECFINTVIQVGTAALTFVIWNWCTQKLMHFSLPAEISSTAEHSSLKNSSNKKKKKECTINKFFVLSYISYETNFAASNPSLWWVFLLENKNIFLISSWYYVLSCAN